MGFTSRSSELSNTLGPSRFLHALGTRVCVWTAHPQLWPFPQALQPCGLQQLSQLPAFCAASSSFCAMIIKTHESSLALGMSVAAPGEQSSVTGIRGNSSMKHWPARQGGGGQCWQLAAMGPQRRWSPGAADIARSGNPSISRGLAQTNLTLQSGGGLGEGGKGSYVLGSCWPGNPVSNRKSQASPSNTKRSEPLARAPGRLCHC